MKIVLYTKNRCRQCTATKKALNNENIEYIEINVDTNAQEKEQLIKEGWTSMPVIKTKTTSWAGFQPDRIKNLKRI